MAKHILVCFYTPQCIYADFVRFAVQYRLSHSRVKMLVVALLRTVLYYGNNVLVGLPATWYASAAARFIRRLKSRDHVTDAIISRHWLRVPQRIQYKLAVLAYKVLHGGAPSYFGRNRSILPRRWPPGLYGCVSSAPTVLCHQSNCLQSAVEPSRSPLSWPPLEQLAWRDGSRWFVVCRPFGANWNIICSNRPNQSLYCHCCSTVLLLHSWWSGLWQQLLRPL